MLELLIVFALASIGIYFTTTTNEPEFSGATRFDLDEFGEDEDGAEEQETGIGILGIDIGRRKKAKRAKQVKQDGPVTLTNVDPSRDTSLDLDAVGDDIAGGEDHLDYAAHDADADRLDDSIRGILDADDDGPSFEFGGDMPTQEEAEQAIDWNDGLGAYEDNEVDLDRISAMARGDYLANEGAQDALQVEEVETDGLVGAAMRSEAVFDDTDHDDGFDDMAGDDEFAMPAPKSCLNGPIIVENFDPEEDQIEIEYDREETGDGRIGITEDPNTPGTARVTLGGKVVAIVPGGYGLVRAHHIDLYPISAAA